MSMIINLKIKNTAGLHRYTNRSPVYEDKWSCYVHQVKEEDFLLKKNAMIKRAKRFLSKIKKSHEAENDLPNYPELKTPNQNVRFIEEKFDDSIVVRTLITKNPFDPKGENEVISFEIFFKIVPRRTGENYDS